MAKPVFLLSHRGAIGDFLLTFPLLSQLREQFKEHRFLLLGYPHLGKIALHLNLIDDVQDCDNFQYMGFYNGGYIPDSLQPIEAGIIWSFPNPDLKDLLEREGLDNVYIIPPFPGDTNMHVITHHMAILKHFDCQPKPAQKVFGFPKKQEPAGITLIHPGAGNPKKVYNFGFYKFIASELKKREHNDIRFLIGPAEKKAKNQFLDWPIEEFSDLIELAAFLAKLTLFIGNDSGISHLSAMTGVPTIAFYKTTSARQWGIRGLKSICIEAPNEAIAMAKLEKRLSSNTI